MFFRVYMDACIGFRYIVYVIMGMYLYLYV